MKNKSFKIVTGPCSVDENNLEEIREICNMQIGNKKVVYGTRIVGVKSRTCLSIDPNDVTNFMGVDNKVLRSNLEILASGGNLRELEIPPSVKYAERIVEETGIIIFTEMMEPLVQAPLYMGRIPKGKLYMWSPAVNQLGWPVYAMAEFARKNGWGIGIKNGKWIGDDFAKAESAEYGKETALEKTWKGLYSYRGLLPSEDTIMIQRGVDIPEKFEAHMRNMPIHGIAKRVKRDLKCQMFFDPSHAYGPENRDKIVEAVIEASQMMIDKDTYLYDGILIEAGTSQSDTEQHITLKELKNMLIELSRIRELIVDRN